MRQAAPDPGPGFVARLVERALGALSALAAWIVAELLQFARDNIYLVGLAIYGFLRATGATVETGHTGVLFSFGRATRTLDPGFRVLLPFLQVVRTIPTRERTLDMAAQRVTTFDGLVFHVDATLVYRVVDARKALIEVDDLQKAMYEMLGLSVHELVRERARTTLRTSDELDRELAERMERRIAPWGVTVEHAGMGSISPSPVTLRLTQLAHRTRARWGEVVMLRAHGLAIEAALPMVGARRIPVRRRLERIAQEHASRRRTCVRRLARIEARKAGITSPRIRGRLRERALAASGLGGHSHAGDDFLAEAPRSRFHLRGRPLGPGGGNWASTRRERLRKEARAARERPNAES